MTRILGIETSCDECSASVIRYTPETIEVESLSTFSQIKLHRPYGGVVPEIASRNHLETVNPMIASALADAGMEARDLDAIAVTNRPGLVGALLVGVTAAKAMAYALKKPLVPVHHLEGHAASVYLHSKDATEVFDRNSIPLPLLVAIVSGGHTNLHVVRVPPELWPHDFLKKSLVGRSRDDAAGEAFDKTAKLLGFPYPGGKWIDLEAKKGGNPRAFDFPRALPQKATFDFSFSGLKTAVALQAADLRKKGELDARLSDLCASVQEAIVDALMIKIKLAVREHGCRALSVVGGVSANSRLRARLEAEGEAMGLEAPPLFPELQYCTDNAAMIAAAGAFRFRRQEFIQGDTLMKLNAVAYPEN